MFKNIVFISIPKLKITVKTKQN